MVRIALCGLKTSPKKKKRAFMLKALGQVQDSYFGKHTVNLGMGGEKLEDVIWRIWNLDACKEVKHVVNLWNQKHR